MAGRGNRVLEKAPDVGGGSGGRRSTAVRTDVAAAVAGVVAVVAGVMLLANAAVGESNRSAAADSSVRSASGQRGPAYGTPLHVLSVTPSAGSSKVSGAVTVQIVFSARLASPPVRPTLTPPVPGRWQVSGNTLAFTPDAPFAPATKFALRIPAGRAGVRSATDGVLGKPVIARFSTAAYSRLRLAELLSQLGYLPLSWQPSAGQRQAGGQAGGVAAQQAMAYSPPAGSFAWDQGYPATLRQLWRSGRPNPLIRGAVMAFQAQHRMAISGLATRRLWRSLFAASAAGQRNAAGYTYAVASKGSPEALTIWHDGQRVFRSLANTGIPVAPTASGTFPVYLRFRFQVMQGTNPDGSHYADPVSFVAYFNGGDAVHYFPRGSYGWPQSLGCVELPYANAERAWPYLTYGSLVTVTG